MCRHVRIYCPRPLLSSYHSHVQYRQSCRAMIHAGLCINCPGYRTQPPLHVLSRAAWIPAIRMLSPCILPTAARVLCALPRRRALHDGATFSSPRPVLHVSRESPRSLPSYSALLVPERKAWTGDATAHAHRYNTVPVSLYSIYPHTVPDTPRRLHIQLLCKPCQDTSKSGTKFRGRMRC